MNVEPIEKSKKKDANWNDLKVGMVIKSSYENYLCLVIDGHCIEKEYTEDDKALLLLNGGFCFGLARGLFEEIANSKFEILGFADTLQYRKQED